MKKQWVGIRKKVVDIPELSLQQGWHKPVRRLISFLRASYSHIAWNVTKHQRETVQYKCVVQSDRQIGNTQMWTHDLAMNYKTEVTHEVNLQDAGIWMQQQKLL